MTINELVMKQKELEHEINVAKLALNKKIMKYFKGIKPTIKHDTHGLIVMVCSDDDGCIAIYTLTASGFEYEDCITEDLATKIKDDVIAVYGELDK